MKSILWGEGKSQLGDSLTKRSAIPDFLLEVIRAARIPYEIIFN